MFRKGSALVVLIAIVSLVAAMSAFGGASSTDVTTVTVTLAKPSEFKITLSKKTIGKGVTTFKVTNKGALSHDFKISGRKTRMLTTGKSATLRTILKKGKYAYPLHRPRPRRGGHEGRPRPSSSARRSEFREGAGDGALGVLGREERDRAGGAAARRRATAVASTISAPIATATSSGERAPIARPIGAWIRPSPASSTPSARRRSSRSAVVTLLPIAPM